MQARWIFAVAFPNLDLALPAAGQARIRIPILTGNVAEVLVGHDVRGRSGQRRGNMPHGFEAHPDEEKAPESAAQRAGTHSAALPQQAHNPKVAGSNPAPATTGSQ